MKPSDESWITREESDMVRTFQHWLKQRFPTLYARIFTTALPLYERYYAARRAQFTKKQSRVITYEGIVFKLELDPANGFVDANIYAHGVYEPEILSIIKRLLPRGGTFVDIGANIGQHSLFAATVAGPKGHVISFEPIPRLATQIRASAALNNLSDTIVVHEIAASDQAGMATFRIRPGNIGGSGLHSHDASHEEIYVSTSPADTLLAEQCRIDLIKIDTEGHELHALRGLTRMLAQFHPALIVEFSPVFWNDEKERSIEEFFSLLEKNGYVCQDIEDSYRTIHEPAIWVASFDRPQTNLLCLAS